MIEVQAVVDQISKNLISKDYLVAIAREQIPDLDVKAVYVAYATITPQKLPNPFDNALLNYHAENMLQSFDITFVTPVSDFISIWTDVFKTLNRWEPLSSEYNATGFIKAEGGKIGLANGNIHWLDRWMYAFPTVNVNL